MAMTAATINPISGNLSIYGDSIITSINMSDTITLGAATSGAGSSGTYYTSGGGSTWNSIPSLGPLTYTNDITMSNQADVIIGNKSLKTFMEKVEDRLAILQPDPEKLEKFAALKAAYEHYKLLEALCSGDVPELKP